MFDAVQDAKSFDDFHPLPLFRSIEYLHHFRVVENPLRFRLHGSSFSSSFSFLPLSFRSSSRMSCRYQLIHAGLGHPRSQPSPWHVGQVRLVSPWSSPASKISASGRATVSIRLMGSKTTRRPLHWGQIANRPCEQTRTSASGFGSAIALVVGVRRLGRDVVFR